MADGGAISIEVEGGERLLRQLNELSRKVSRKITRETLTKALRPVEMLARQLAPVDTGLLAGSIRIRAGKRSRSGVSRIVGQTERAFYGTFQEFGYHLGRRANNETIGVRKGKKRTESEQARIASMNAERPFVDAQPFLKPAMQAHEDRIPEVFAAELRAALASI